MFAGCFGIFGHGNVAGVGQALLESALSGEPGLAYLQARNEQAMVHAASGYARMRNRLSTFACTTSIGPGATNMVTGAALATINRLPVLLLPGDIFATRVASPVLQELEDPGSYDVSVNDAFRPVSRFWDRINRPEQLPSSLLAAMRVLTDPVDTGAVTLALPQDVQAEAFDWPGELLEPRVWHVRRPVPEPARSPRRAELLRAARRPLIVAGGGTIYAEATDALAGLAEATGIPVAETQAGKGSLPYDHPLRGRGDRRDRHDRGERARARGRRRARRGNPLERLHDGVADRCSPRTTCGSSASTSPPSTRSSRPALPLVADARAGARGAARRPRRLAARTPPTRRGRASSPRNGSGRCSTPTRSAHGPLPAQSEVIGAVNRVVRAARRRGLRGGQHARRAAQAVADARPEGLPRRVRLLVHGLRDRRAGSGSSSPRPTARSSCWSATART